MRGLFVGLVREDRDTCVERVALLRVFMFIERALFVSIFQWYYLYFLYDNF